MTRMPTTYQAILKGDRVEWIGDAPATRGDVRVEITLPAEPVVVDDIDAPAAHPRGT
jgi:hypothetical protein